MWEYVQWSTCTEEIEWKGYVEWDICPAGVICQVEKYVQGDMSSRGVCLEGEYMSMWGMYGGNMSNETGRKGNMRPEKEYAHLWNTTKASVLGKYVQLRDMSSGYCPGDKSPNVVMWGSAEYGDSGVCVGFNYDETQLLCELFNSPYDTVTLASGCIYYEVSRCLRVVYKLPACIHVQCTCSDLRYCNSVNAFVIVQQSLFQ